MHACMYVCMYICMYGCMSSSCLSSSLSANMLLCLLVSMCGSLSVCLSQIEWWLRITSKWQIAVRLTYVRGNQSLTTLQPAVCPRLRVTRLDMCIIATAGYVDQVSTGILLGYGSFYHQQYYIAHIKTLVENVFIYQYCINNILLSLVPEIHCGDLEAPSNGTKHGSSDVVDSTMTFSCDVGFRLEGSEQRHCTEDGHWNGTKATCRKCCQRMHFLFFHLKNSNFTTSSSRIRSCRPWASLRLLLRRHCAEQCTVQMGFSFTRRNCSMEETMRPIILLFMVSN